MLAHPDAPVPPGALSGTAIAGQPQPPRRCARPLVPGARNGAGSRPGGPATDGDRRPPVVLAAPVRAGDATESAQFIARVRTPRAAGGPGAHRPLPPYARPFRPGRSRPLMSAGRIMAEMCGLR